ncbi:dipeptidase [Steroidobacter sp.]|uniref:dipeptidase n=1 Tax=Steroidobacter sp. TaxID=1978227 RepID=UPI001A5819A1|nr:membrane dipeptidase [Steroidobacter sp.]MBL8265907.1 membrane dipeptidase [Steroidobacter sp.]
MKTIMNRRGFVACGVAAAVTGMTARATNDAVASSTERSTLVVNGLDTSSLTPEYLQLLRKGGVSCMHRSTGGSLDAFAAMLTFFDQHSAEIAPAGSVREIRRLHQQGKLSHVSGWQSAESLIVDGEPVPKNLRAYHELGLRLCGIAYNFANDFGGGCLDPQVGLTRAGHRLVEEIHRSRIVLDVGGHTNEQTSFEALAISGGVPVICSHTNIKALNDNPRCSTDRLLEAIARTGGVIGLTAFNDFHARKASDAHIALTPQVSLQRHLDQYDYLKRLVGVEHIGLGPDFISGRNQSGRLAPEVSQIMVPEAYSQQMPWFYVRGFENIGELPNVTQGLRQRGWSEAELHQVLGENWLRVYQRVWGA